MMTLQCCDDVDEASSLPRVSFALSHPSVRIGLRDDGFFLAEFCAMHFEERGIRPEVRTIASLGLAKLSLLKYRNARYSHIYIRPYGEHSYTALDDLSEISLAKLTADGFTQCAIVETSAGNFQAWLKHRVVFPNLLGTFVE